MIYESSKLAQKEYKDKAWLGGKGNLQGILKDIEIWQNQNPSKKIRLIKSAGIFRSKWITKSQPEELNNNKKRTCHLDFAAPTEHWVKMNT